MQNEKIEQPKLDSVVLCLVVCAIRLVFPYAIGLLVFPNDCLTRFIRHEKGGAYWLASNMAHAPAPYDSSLPGGSEHGAKPERDQNESAPGEK